MFDQKRNTVVHCLLEKESQSTYKNLLNELNMNLNPDPEKYVINKS